MFGLLCSCTIPGINLAQNEGVSRSPAVLEHRDASMLANPQQILRVTKLQGMLIPPPDLSGRPPEVAVR